MNAKTRIRKKVLSLHGLHGLQSAQSARSAVCSLQSAWSAFWGDRKKKGQDYFCDPVFRITSPDVITSSDVKIHPLRIDIDLSRFVLVGREFFGRSRIFLDAAVAKCPAAGQDLEWTKCPVRELGHTIKSQGSFSHCRSRSQID